MYGKLCSSADRVRSTLIDCVADRTEKGTATDRVTGTILSHFESLLLSTYVSSV